MWRIKLAVVGLATLCLLGAARPTPKKPVADKAEPKDFLRIKAAEIQRDPQKFVDKLVKIEDVFGEGIVPNRFPRELKAKGVTPQTHYGFRTHRVVGSDMTCFVPKGDEDAVKILRTAVNGETELLVYGQLRWRLGIDKVFLVERLIRGWEEPVRPKVRLTLVLGWHDANKMHRMRRYPIPVPGKTYYIRCPHTGKRMEVTIQIDY